MKLKEVRYRFNLYGYWWDILYLAIYLLKVKEIQDIVEPLLKILKLKNK